MNSPIAVLAEENARLRALIAAWADAWEGVRDGAYMAYDKFDQAEDDLFAEVGR